MCIMCIVCEMCVCMRVYCTCTCALVYLCVCVCVCVYMSICAYVCIYIWYVYLCVCVCPCMYASLSFRQTWNWCLSTQQFHASWTLRTMPASQANRFWKTNVLAEPDPVLETGTHCTNNQELCCTPEHRQKPIVMSRLEVQKPTVYLYG